LKILADENLFEPIVVHLKALGHEVMSVRDSGLSGITDDAVYQLACKEKRVIITMDKDFSRTFRFPPERCGGVIVVKIYKRTVEETVELFKKHFGSLNLRNMVENLVVITPDGVRIRRTRL